MSDLKVTVENGVKELVIRQGDAPKVQVPKKLELSGSIQGPVEFATKRKADIDAKKTYVEYSYEKGTIKLVVGEKDEVNTVVTGALEKTPQLQQLEVFTGSGMPKERTVTEMSRLLKFNKGLFAESDVATKMIESLAKLKIKVDQTIEKNDNERGNKKDNFEVSVTSGIPLDFTLSVPLFKGFPNSKFKVEVCFDVRDRSISLWLESPELTELIYTETQKIIMNQTAQLTDYVMIEK